MTIAILSYISGFISIALLILVVFVFTRYYSNDCGDKQKLLESYIANMTTLTFLIVFCFVSTRVKNFYCSIFMACILIAENIFMIIMSIKNNYFYMADSDCDDFYIMINKFGIVISCSLLILCCIFIIIFMMSVLLLSINKIGNCLFNFVKYTVMFYKDKYDEYRRQTKKNKPQNLNRLVLEKPRNPYIRTENDLNHLDRTHHI